MKSNLNYNIYAIMALYSVFLFGENKNLIIINKKNVIHKFVPYDEPTDHFTKNVFQNWENDTFAIFDQVKDPEGIAIDIGAWIGTTAIWLSKNFKHVLAIDADKISLDCLQKNLIASECSNVAICSQPVAQTAQRVVFGPRGTELNESISYIKPQADKSDDYTIQAITFKQLIHDYVYTNEKYNSHSISFIKCDIEGGEENILEDILYFSYYNKIKVYLSFHLEWWKSKKITDFEYLFKFFKTNCPHSNLIEYLQKNPWASVLFEPLDTAETLIKKNIPVVIIGYNQVSYIKNMVSQIEKYTSDIIVIDNNSTYQPLLDYYKNEFSYSLLRQKANLGSSVYTQGFVQNLVGDVFLLTDPDLQFNANLPENFIQQLINISDYFHAHRVGFALEIDSENIRTDVKFYGFSIKEWEQRFWKRKLIYPINTQMELYKADIDTTFALHNKKYPSGVHIRVAGNFTCLHLPWYNNFKSKLQPDEYEFYMQHNISTNWFKH